MHDETIRIRMPPKQHVDIFLAAVAGALAVVVALTARGVMSTHDVGPATPAPIATPTATGPPTADGTAPAAPAANPKKDHGKGRD